MLQNIEAAIKSLLYTIFLEVVESKKENAHAHFLMMKIIEEKDIGACKKSY